MRRDHDLYHPIVQRDSVSGWKEIPIHECGELLVPLGAFSHYPQIATDSIYAGERNSSPYHYAELKGSPFTVFVREGVAEQLAKAATFLPPRHMLLVWDGYRPLAVQDEQIKPSPHSTGGSIDLTIIRFSQEDWREVERLTEIVRMPETSENWREIYSAEMARQQLIREASMPLEMGTVFDSLRPETATRFYEERAQILLGEKWQQRLANRRLLWNVMTAVGFSNYGEKWWHFDSGNQFDAARTGRPAIYGVAVFSKENENWETMRRGHYFGSVAIAERRPQDDIYLFVSDVTRRAGHPGLTIHPQAAML